MDEYDDSKLSFLVLRHRDCQTQGMLRWNSVAGWQLNFASWALVFLSGRTSVIPRLIFW